MSPILIVSLILIMIHYVWENPSEYKGLETVISLYILYREVWANCVNPDQISPLKDQSDQGYNICNPIIIFYTPHLI